MSRSSSDTSNCVRSSQRETAFLVHRRQLQCKTSDYLHVIIRNLLILLHSIARKGMKIHSIKQTCYQRTLKVIITRSMTQMPSSYWKQVFFTPIVCENSISLCVLTFEVTASSVLTSLLTCYKHSRGLRRVVFYLYTSTFLCHLHSSQRFCRFIHLSGWLIFKIFHGQAYTTLNDSVEQIP